MGISRGTSHCWPWFPLWFQSGATLCIKHEPCAVQCVAGAAACLLGPWKCMVSNTRSGQNECVAAHAWAWLWRGSSVVPVWFQCGSGMVPACGPPATSVAGPSGDPVKLSNLPREDTPGNMGVRVAATFAILGIAGLAASPGERSATSAAPDTSRRMKEPQHHHLRPLR